MKMNGPRPDDLASDPETVTRRVEWWADRMGCSVDCQSGDHTEEWGRCRYGPEWTTEPLTVTNERDVK